MTFMEVKQRRVRYGGGFGSVDRRDLSLRAVSVPVVLPARWGIGSQKNQESMGRGVGSKKRNHVSIFWVSVWLVSVVAR
jgi:hypothetical protein